MTAACNCGHSHLMRCILRNHSRAPWYSNQLFVSPSLDLPWLLIHLESPDAKRQCDLRHGESVHRQVFRSRHPSANDRRGSIRRIVRPAPSQFLPPCLCPTYHRGYLHVWKPDAMPCGLVCCGLHCWMLVRAKLLNRCNGTA